MGTNSKLTLGETRGSEHPTCAIGSIMVMICILVADMNFFFFFSFFNSVCILSFVIRIVIYYFFSCFILLF